jgi:hypothetical protein
VYKFSALDVLETPSNSRSLSVILSASDTSDGFDNSISE